MNLNHINLMVTDVQETYRFLEKETEVRYPVNFHIGFGQPGEEAVNEVNRRLKADGFDVPEPSRQHGSWTFYFRAPGGFTVEVLA